MAYDGWSRSQFKGIVKNEVSERVTSKMVEEGEFHAKLKLQEDRYKTAVSSIES